MTQSVIDLQRKLARTEEERNKYARQCLRHQVEIDRLQVRTEAAEAELRKAREQEPVTWFDVDYDGGITHPMLSPFDFSVGRHYLYADPKPAAPAVQFNDEFNGDTPHMIKCIESLLAMDAKGILAPHGIGGHARTLLAAAACRLSAPAVDCKNNSDVADKESCCAFVDASSKPKPAAPAVPELQIEKEKQQ